LARDAKALPGGKLEVNELLDPKELVAMLGLAVQVRDGRYGCVQLAVQNCDVGDQVAN
jgi:hypothetical protein